MTNNGIVTEEINDKVKIKFIKQSACGGNCSSCSGCKTKDVEVLVHNNVNAKVGDKVMVESPTSSILLNAFLLYILPLIMFFTAYFITVKRTNEGIGIISGVSAFILTFIIVSLARKNYKQDIKIIKKL